MQDADETTITQAVLDSFADTPDPRLRALVTALVKHAHAFIRETEPSFEEWQAAIGFLTRTGHMCTGKRQEFILLSDVLGISMLVDAINHRQPAGATETTVLGPFHIAGAPQPLHGADISGGLEGEKLLVEGSVHAVGGAPIGGRRWRCGRLTITASMTCKSRVSMGPNSARRSRPTRKAGSISGPSRRPSTPSRTTARWASCWVLPAATRTGQRTCIS